MADLLSELEEFNFVQEETRRIKALVVGVGYVGCTMLDGFLSGNYEYLTKKGNTDTNCWEFHKVNLGKSVQTLAMGFLEENLDKCRAANKINFGEDDALCSEKVLKLAEYFEFDLIITLADFDDHLSAKATLELVKHFAKDTFLLISIVTAHQNNLEAQKLLTGIEDNTNSLIFIPKQDIDCRVLQPHGENFSPNSAYGHMLEAMCCLLRAALTIGFICVDLSDVATILLTGKQCYIGYGSATGSDASAKALVQALESAYIPHDSLSRASSILAAISTHPDESLDNFCLVHEIIHEKINQEADIIVMDLLAESKNSTSITILVCMD